MANVTVCSDFDYVIHIHSSGLTASGKSFRLQEQGFGTTFEVEDTGVFKPGGKFVIDGSTTFVVRNSDLSGTNICRFYRGSTPTLVLKITGDGLSDARSSEVLLRNSSTPPDSPADGDIYWHESGGSWYLRVYWNGGWSDLTTA